MAKGFPRGMGGGMGNMNQMIKQAQKMQEQRPFRTMRYYQIRFLPM